MLNNFIIFQLMLGFYLQSGLSIELRHLSYVSHDSHYLLYI